MKIKHLIIAVLTALSFTANGQAKKGIEYSSFFDSYYWRGPTALTFGAGTTGYFGDVCGDLSCVKPRFDFNLGLGYKVWPRIFIGGELDYVNFKAESIHSVNIFHSELEPFAFTSNSIEFTGYTNIFLREDIVRKHQDLVKDHLLVKPYLYLGATAARMVAKSNVNDMEYPKYAFFLPVGIGTMFDVTYRVKINLEVIYKYGFTDGLDGISESANAYNPDNYAMLRFKIVYAPKAKRVKPKKIKADRAERKKWSEHSSNSATSGEGKEESEPKEESPEATNTPDPDEDDSYYTEEDEVEEEEEYYEEEPLEEEPVEEEPIEEEESEDDWGGDW